MTTPGVQKLPYWEIKPCSPSRMSRCYQQVETDNALETLEVGICLMILLLLPNLYSTQI